MFEPRDGSREIKEVLDLIRERGLKASRGRDFQIIGVTKTFPVQRVLDGYRAGLRDFGENYADELAAKASSPELNFPGDPIRWHFLGAVQSRKIRVLAPLVSVWHSVSRPKEIVRISTASPGAAIFVQVDFSHSQQRSGASLDSVEELVNLGRGRGLNVLGLMVVPPLVSPRETEEIFRTVEHERLRLALKASSMGMSDDYEMALSSGSTHIRIGRALFGDRNASGARIEGSKLGQGGPE